MSTVTVTSLDNGLTVHRAAVDGTRAITILLAFDAGARTEREERLDGAEEASRATERISLSRRELQALIDEAIQQDRSRS